MSSKKPLITITAATLAIIAICTLIAYKKGHSQNNSKAKISTANRKTQKYHSNTGILSSNYTEYHDEPLAHPTPRGRFWQKKKARLMPISQSHKQASSENSRQKSAHKASARQNTKSISENRQATANPDKLLHLLRKKAKKNSNKPDTSRKKSFRKIIRKPKKKKPPAKGGTKNADTIDNVEILNASDFITHQQSSSTIPAYVAEIKETSGIGANTKIIFLAHPQPYIQPGTYMQPGSIGGTQIACTIACQSLKACKILAVLADAHQAQAAIYLTGKAKKNSEYSEYRITKIAHPDLGEFSAD